MEQAPPAEKDRRRVIDLLIPFFLGLLIGHLYTAYHLLYFVAVPWSEAQIK